MSNSNSSQFIMNRISRRVSKMMLTHLNNLSLYPKPAPHSIKPNQNPSLVSLQVQFFSTSRLTHNQTKPLLAQSDSTQLVTSPFSNRVSRTARAEGQEALFDYLHCTRSFGFTDAEHISKNCPKFLENLLSKVDCEKEVASHLKRFLRYNPINEFEPFFESLGMAPSELPLFLPRHLMYLSDDPVMCENFHALCDYGVPRSKIGRMYKEAREIFRYEYGVLSSKLRDYECLGLSKGTIVKLVSCCPSLLVGGVNNELVKFLEKLMYIGLGMDWIGGYASDNCTYYWNRMLDMMEFLGNVGYTKEQMCSLFVRNPALLLEGSGKNVYVLFGRLLKLGLEMSEVYSLFMQYPQVLSVKSSRYLLKALDYLIEVGMGMDEIADVVVSDLEFLSSSRLKRPSTVCKELKVGRDGLLEVIREDPRKVLRLASKSKPTTRKQVVSQVQLNHLEKTSFLMRLGYTENSEEMNKALKKFRGRGDQLQERFDCLVEAGLDCNVVMNMIKQAPMVLNQSKQMIVKKISCLTNCIGYPLESVAGFPAYLCYDMERINLRFSMYAWLREKRAAKPTLSLSTLLACSDARFVKYYVDIHPEGPIMWESLKKQKEARAK